MSNIVEGRKPTKEEQNINDYFVEMQRDQLIYLSEAGKRIVEIVSTFLGLLFIAIAFGKDYPPPYLDNNIVRIFTLLTMLFMILAFAFALWTASPLKISYRNRDITSMRHALEITLLMKSRTLRTAGLLFFMGLVNFTLLLTIILLG